MKVVINVDWGGFGISEACARRMAELGDTDAKNMIDEYERRKTSATEFESDRYWYCYWSGKRDNPVLIRAVKELGAKSWGTYAKLKVVNIPDGTEYEIDDYDGRESIHEKHRSWD